MKRPPDHPDWNRLFEVAEGVLIVGRPHGLPAGERAKAEQPSPVGGRAGLGQVVGDLRGLLVEGGGVEPLECVGHEQVQAPAAGRGEPGEKGLADELMGEEQPVLIGRVGQRRDEPGASPVYSAARVV